MNRGMNSMSIVRFGWAEIHKYYKECNWSKKWAEGLQKNFNLKGLHRLDINDCTFFLFLFGVTNVV